MVWKEWEGGWLHTFWSRCSNYKYILTVAADFCTEALWITRRQSWPEQWLWSLSVNSWLLIDSRRRGMVFSYPLSGNPRRLHCISTPAIWQMALIKLSGSQNETLREGFEKWLGNWGLGTWEENEMVCGENNQDILHRYTKHVQKYQRNSLINKQQNTVKIDSRRYLVLTSGLHTHTGTHMPYTHTLTHTVTHIYTISNHLHF